MWTGFWVGILMRDYLFFPLPNAKGQTANFLTISLREEKNESSHTGVTFNGCLIYVLVFDPISSLAWTLSSDSYLEAWSVANEVLGYQELAHVLKEAITCKYFFILLDLGFLTFLTSDTYFLPMLKIFFNLGTLFSVYSCTIFKGSLLFDIARK